MPKLLVQEVGKRRWVVDVGAEPIVVGRAAENAIVIQDRKSSRKHCRFLKVGDAVFIEDMNSSNGTLLNGQPAAREELSQGDTVRVGDVVIVYYADDSVVPQDTGNGATTTAAPPAPPAAAPPPVEDSILEDPADGEAPAVAVPEPTVPRVLIENGPLEGQEQDVTPLPFTIGRKSDNALVLPDNRVSGQHCRVVQEAGRWVMEDLDSGNGIRVDGVKVSRHALRNGERLLLGSTEVSFRGLPVRVVPGDATPLAVIHHIDSFDISEEDISRLAVAQAVTPQSPLQWVWTLLFVTFLGLVLVLGYRLVDEQLAQGRVPHDPDNRIVNNPSFEKVSENGQVVGWEMDSRGADGRVESLQGDRVRHGRRAVRLSTTAPDADFVRLVSTDLGPVKVGQLVELTGLLRNGSDTGNGFPVAGLEILWMVRTADGERIIAESFSRMVRPGSSFRPLRVRARPPAGVQHVRAALFGWGRGSLEADDLALRIVAPTPAGDAAATNSFETIKMESRVGDNERLLLALRGDGSVSVARERDAVIRNLWFSSVLSGRYPFGQLLAVKADPPSRRENGLVTSRYAYLIGAREEISVEQLVREESGTFRLDFRLLVSAKDDAPTGRHGLVVELEPRAERAGSTLYNGGELVVAVDSPSALDGETGDEWVIGQGSGQVILRFTPAVHFTVVATDTGRRGAAICVSTHLEAPDYLLEVALSTVSTREEERIAALGAQVKGSLERRNFGRTLDVLTMLEKEFPWRDDVQDEVRTVRARIRLTGERMLTELKEMYRDFKHYPAIPVKTVLRERAETIIASFRGESQEQRAGRIVKELDREDSEVREELARGSAEDLMVIGRRYYQSQRNHLARFYFEWVIERFPDSEKAEEAANFLKLIEARR